MKRYIIIAQAERNGASEDFIKFLEAGYNMERSLVYKNIVKSIKSNEDSLENYIERAGNFTKLLWEGNVEKAYRIADSKNSKILEESHDF